MRNHVVGTVLLSLLAGCTADWDSTKTADSARLARAAAGHGVIDGTMQPATERVGRLRSAGGFASLPDRGELFAFMAPAGQRLGAKGAFRVRLSEEHAFNAAHEGGKIVVPTPDGGVTTLAYASHVEHPDGNWSWIGRDERGADAIITFGEKAVFGTIQQRYGRAWRLTTTAGGAWLVGDDRSKVAPMGPGERSVGTDVMHPPKMAGERSQTGAAGAHANVTMAASTATTVDVLLGYTQGFANAYGGQSQAVTRLNNLITVANQAYANSAITERLRLVGTVMVTYPDNTDNGDALEELSGQTETGPTTPNPAFNALRSARETTGADLVALVRDFRTPESNGCGIAWLIGGGQTGISQADAPYGYAVVSDGTDVDEGDGFLYVCRDESLAHEFGHNMGQAHNQEDSGQSGVHAYSYGYRQTSSNGFYTVMAYAAGEDQFSIPYFANPNVNYDDDGLPGRPTGVANVSDNARSMNQTMPIVATFRAQVGSGARNDINGDGKSDLIFRNAAAQLVGWWEMNGAQAAMTRNQGAGGDYVLKATGDFNGDGKDDLVWVSAARKIVMFLSTGTAFTSATVTEQFAAGWTLDAAADINGDGKSDLIFSNASAQLVGWWEMNGAQVGMTRNQSAGSAYTLKATGDFNGDGKGDLVWANAGRRVVMFLSTGAGFTSATVTNEFGASWTLEPAADINGDGKSDLIFRNTDSQLVQWWEMNGAQISTARRQVAGGGYVLKATGDFNGDGKGDLVWASAARKVVMFLSTGTAFSSVTVTNDHGAAWTIVN